jgi:hypothetical protein
MFRVLGLHLGLCVKFQGFWVKMVNHVGFWIKMVNHVGFWVKGNWVLGDWNQVEKANEKFWFNKRKIQSFVQDNYIINIVYIGIAKILQLKSLVNIIMTQQNMVGMVIID